MARRVATLMMMMMMMMMLSNRQHPRCADCLEEWEGHQSREMFCVVLCTTLAHTYEQFSQLN